jgi:hypothetical protein
MRINDFFHLIPIRSNLANKILCIFNSFFFFLVSNVECDLTRSAGARYRDSNSDYVNTSQQHYVLYGDRNAPIDSPISSVNSVNQNEGRVKEKIFS